VEVRRRWLADDQEATSGAVRVSVLAVKRLNRAEWTPVRAFIDDRSRLPGDVLITSRPTRAALLRRARGERCYP
jgi:hypothetical protein